MATFKDTKVVGGVGAILSLIGVFIPSIGVVVSIMGFIMVLIAVKYISDIVNDPSIFRNMLASVICGIVSVAISIVFVFTYFMAMFSTSFFFTNGLAPEPMISRPFLPFIAPIIVMLVIVWVFMVVSALYLRKSYNRISTVIQVNLFRTAATTYFIGALLLIVVVGGIVLLLAKIIEIIAFFSIPEQQPVQTQIPPPPPP